MGLEQAMNLTSITAKFFLLTLIAFVGCAGLSAGTLNCNSLSMQYLVANAGTQANGCLVGDSLFYGFNFSAAPSALLNPTDVSVTTVNNADNPSITFNLDKMIHSGDTLLLDIMYFAAAPSGGAFGSISQTTTGNVNKDGYVVTTFTVCQDASCSESTGATETLTKNGVSTGFSANFSSSGAPWLKINNSVYFDGGSQSGSHAHVLGVDNTLGMARSLSAVGDPTAAPEPVSMLLMGSGLAALGFIRRRALKA
jgi:hypothetical protein